MKVAIHSITIKALKALTFLYCTLMFTFFLFYTENAYFNITDAKYHCFVWLTLGYALSCIICGSFYLFFHDSPINFIKNQLVSLSSTDKSMLLMLGAHTITTISCEYPQYSFSGAWGRHMGLGFTILICIMYFLVSRFLTHHRILIHIFLGSCLIVGCIGILNALGIDPFHYYINVKQSQRHMFLSTIGNTTFFAHMFCLTLPIGFSLFLNATSLRKRIVYLIWTMLGFVSIYISNIDGAYLAVFAFLLYFFMNCRDAMQMKDFLLICLTALCTAKCLSLLSYGSGALVFEGVSALIVLSPFVWILIGIVLLLYLWMRKYPDKAEALPYHKIKTMVLMSAGIIILLLLVAIVYFTWLKPSASLGDLSDYLRFSDTWGHNRGYLWRVFTTDFIHSSPLERMFGKGLDCTKFIMSDISGKSLATAYYDNAHNEYLQYLITSGIIGLSAYLFLWGSLIHRLYQIKHHPYATGLCAALLAHGAQAITGLNQPITTPLLFLLFAISERLLRRTSASKTADSSADDTSST